MKEAAGNYMPDYGNWRFISPPPPVEEEEPEEKLIPPPDDEPEPIPKTEPELKTFEDEEEWGEQEDDTTEVIPYEGRKVKNGVVGVDGYEQWEKDEYDEYVAHTQKEDYVPYEQKPENQRTIKGEDNRGGVKRTGNIDPDGTYIDIKEEYHGAPKPDDHVSTLPSSASTFQKRSPYKMDEGEPHPNTGVRPGSFADPLSGGELKAARQAIVDRGSTASTHYHDQSKEIVKDIKANMFQKEGDDKSSCYNEAA